jgi:hypothetical protein
VLDYSLSRRETTETKSVPVIARLLAQPTETNSLRLDARLRELCR